MDVSARIIGDVTIARGCSVWPMAVIRADSAPLRIGIRSAVLDLALIEAPKGHPVLLEDEVLVSHGAMVHGASIETGVLVGIGAILLDGVHIAAGSIIGAGSLVTAGTRIPPCSLVLGSPGKVIRQTTEQERENIRLQIAELFEKSRSFISE